MNTLQHDVIATLKSCLPIYKKLYEIPGYKITEDELGCLEKFHELVEAGLLDDDEILEQAGKDYEMFGRLIGYASIAIQSKAK